MAGQVTNLLLQHVEYLYEETPLGIRRSFVYPNGQRFSEFRSTASALGLPLVHTTHGVCPETGRRVIARGWYAQGRIAMGGIAVGQLSLGVLAVGQAAFGVLFGLGQLATGAIAAGQAALGTIIGVGQFASGYFALGQFAAGVEAFGQLIYRIGG